MEFNNTESMRLGTVELTGDLVVPDEAEGIVVFAHGSGSSRKSERNRYVAQTLHDRGLGTLLFDLLTEEEEEAERATRHLRFDIDLLADRMNRATDWLERQAVAKGRSIGYFGASTGAAAALKAISTRQNGVRTVVSRGGRPDLAAGALPKVRVPVLLIVGGADKPVIELNREAAGQLGDHVRMEIVEGASHLFKEPGALEEVAHLAGDWFEDILVSSSTRHGGQA